MMPTSPLPSVFDTQSLATLRRGLSGDDPSAIRAAAQQFEALLLQTMLKSMRAATPQDGIFDSDQTRFYQELLDSQLAQVMAAKGGTGLAAVIERQLSRRNEAVPPENHEGLPLFPARPALPLSPVQAPRQLPAERLPAGIPLDGVPARPATPIQPSAGQQVQNDNLGHPRQFASSLWPQALEASRQTGIPAQFMLGHAALESGWGRAEPRHPDGRPSHNLFGIKAGGQWTGEVVEAVTTEYVNGQPERRVERFRAYRSYAEAFRDYAELLLHSPRYAAVVGSQDAGGFARALQRAGYATDPAYAAKLESVINGVTLRQALTG